MRRLPVKTTYKVQEPYPEQITLTQLIDISQAPKEFKLTEVCCWIGRIGVVQQVWSTELVDWYFPKLEYVCVRRLERGKQLVAGPFKYCSSSEWFIKLADAENKEISHPKYLKKETDNECTYSSTAVWIWSPHCLCKSAAEERRDVGVHCICQVVFDRYSCKCQQLHEAEAVQTKILDRCIDAERVIGSIEAIDEKEVATDEKKETQKEAEDKELDEVLSQNFCICTNVFGDGSECYCGFQPVAKAETTSSEEGVDVPGEIFDKLQAYLEEKATMAIMAFERGDAHLLLHIQSMFTIRTTSTRKLKEDIRAVVGWKDSAPLGNSLCMIRSGQYMPGLKWATMKPMSQLRVERIWQGCAPETITMSDVDYILFGSIHNDRYFSSSHRMELLIAEARKRKDEDQKPDDRQKAMDTEDDRQDPSEETEGDKAANDREEDEDPFEVAARNEPAMQAIDDENPNLLQPRAAGSPDEGFDDAELPDVVDLDDIIEPGMDTEVLMFDLLAAGYGVRRRPPPRPEEARNDQEQQHNVQVENNDQMPEYIPLVRPPT
ncbi:hypothetical protein R1sor_022813 [Riccia sorocarpa]|uniref:Uncharacterized protein n=1 Tax=Riccia sorocarpa TaxID=122646 RepID=A0ABD3GN04_9MARC